MLGAIIGDIVGSVYEFNNIKTKDFPLFLSKSRPTDDSIMTFAIAECIQKRYVHDENKIINTLKKWGHLYPYAGYGGRFFYWLFTDNTSPYNSCGNGSAMRISAAGWYGRNEEEVKELAYNLTAVTHNHPEGLKGAEVTAMCIYYARIGKSKVSSLLKQLCLFLLHWLVSLMLRMQVVLYVPWLIIQASGIILYLLC